MSNVPDDWGSYYSECSECGAKMHASEGGCSHCPGPVYMDLEDEGYTLTNEDNQRWVWVKETTKYIYYVEDYDGTKDRELRLR